MFNRLRAPGMNLRVFSFGTFRFVWGKQYGFHFREVRFRNYQKEWWP